ncbi:hypothetical protein Vadar_012253 [Vaccinium darrowii]|uniref:Uncharacterized protein n=1 Tax=Vaccinium darrowii TaxID=229202 RepID=A0ACB7Z3B8_9ERIC|nr:hypothetical protein Vadar_012253 [Vaccinium darrowii]
MEITCSCKGMVFDGRLCGATLSLISSYYLLPISATERLGEKEKLCGGGFTVAKNATRIRPIQMRDMQPGVPTGPEPPNASATPQVAVEASKAGVAGREQTGICLPRNQLPAP